MTVSGIIPCYNAATTIARAVMSLVNQTETLKQIIVVDDGSTDHSLQVIQKLQLEYPIIEIILQSNKGVCYSRNKALENAYGEYILTLDADDYFEPTFVEKALYKFEEKQSVAAVMCGYVRVVDGKKIKPYIPQTISLRSCLIDNGAISCMLFKKDVLIEVGMYDVSMTNGYEDWDLNIRILKSGYEYSVVEEILFNYTDTPESRSYDATQKDIEYRMNLYHKYETIYLEHAAYVYERLIRRQLELKTQAEKVLETRSFKLGNSILSSVRSVIGIFKIK